jgi:hypothetical protein
MSCISTSGDIQNPYLKVLSTGQDIVKVLLPASSGFQGVFFRQRTALKRYLFPSHKAINFMLDFG